MPGTPTLPDLILRHRAAYEDALDAAEAAWREGRVDVSGMETLLSELFAQQLTRVYGLAGGLIAPS